MITLDRVTKYYSTPLGRHFVLRDVSMTVPLGRNIGVIGRNGAGKSTLLRLMAGVDYPNRGRIHRVGRYSWPLALAGRGIQGSMTGKENVIFAARIHGLWGKQIEQLVRRVAEFSELDDFFEMPVSTYSSGMRARLSFAVAMLFEFDCYFIDELNAVGDTRFRRLTKEYFAGKRKTATFIQVSHDLDELHKICDAGILVDDGEATYFEHVDDAIKAYRDIVGEPADSADEGSEAQAGTEIAPVVVAQSRQARRLMAQARRRQRLRAKASAEAASAEDVQEAGVVPEPQELKRQRRPNRRPPNRRGRDAVAEETLPLKIESTDAEPAIAVEQPKRRRRAVRSKKANRRRTKLLAANTMQLPSTGIASTGQANQKQPRQGRNLERKRQSVSLGLSPAQQLAAGRKPKSNRRNSNFSRGKSEE